MGYYSMFEVTMIDGTDLPEDFQLMVQEVSGYIFEATKSKLSLLNSIKWYQQEEDMIKISLMYPDRVIAVKKVGEDPDDEMIYYYLNGEDECFLVEKTFPDTTFTSTQSFGTVKPLS